jgi:hypothetical protein
VTITSMRSFAPCSSRNRSIGARTLASKTSRVTWWRGIPPGIVSRTTFSAGIPRAARYVSPITRDIASASFTTINTSGCVSAAGAAGGSARAVDAPIQTASSAQQQVRSTGCRL